MKAEIEEAIKSARAKNKGKIAPASDIYEAIFKAGKEQGYVEGCFGIIEETQKAHRAGIREVVEWLEKYYSGLLNKYSGVNKYLIPRGDRQAKFKEWGIKND